MNQKHAAIVLGLMCLLLALAIVIQIKTVRTSLQEIDPTFRENELRDEVLKWKEKYDNSFSSLEKAEKELEKQRTNAVKNDESSTQKEEELKTNNTYLGLTDVSGKGVIITLRDNQSVTSDTATDNIRNYIIHDLDILQILNELKNAGAEAISINDQRMIPTSSITCIGNVVKINGEKIGAPFIIKAIGTQETLYENLKRPGGILDQLDGWITTDIKKANNLVITKYNGVLSYKYLKEAK